MQAVGPVWQAVGCSRQRVERGSPRDRYRCGGRLPPEGAPPAPMSFVLQSAGSGRRSPNAGATSDRRSEAPAFGVPDLP